MMPLFETIFFRSWWVILFILLCLFLFEHAVEKRNRDYSRLSIQLAELQSTKVQAVKEQEDLLLQINSESDPAWIELTLMLGLGMVSENQTKIFFTKNE